MWSGVRDENWSVQGLGQHSLHSLDLGEAAGLCTGLAKPVYGVFLGKGLRHCEVCAVQTSITRCAFWVDALLAKLKVCRGEVSLLL